MDKKIEKKKWTPKKITYASAIAVFVGFLLYMIFFMDSSRKLNVEKERVTISTVEYSPFQEFIPVSGTVEPIETFFLDVTDGGRVVTKFVEEGTFLEVGDPIIQLENPDMSLRIMYNEAQLFQQINSLRSTRLYMEQNRLQLEGQLLQTEKDLIKQKRKYENAKILYDKQYISKIEFEETQDDYEYLLHLRDLTSERYKQDSIFQADQIQQLEVGIERMKANLDMIKMQMENLTIKAPIKGQLTALNAEIGQSINRGQNLGRIDDVDNFKIRVQIDEHYLSKITKGLMGEFPFADKNYKVEIKTVYVQVTNGRFEVDMNFVDEVPTGIRRGQTVRIKLELGDLTDAITIARGGFYQTTGGQWIFVLDESSTVATKRQISLGRQNTMVFEVLSGLKEGEKVITSSYDNYGDVDKLVLN
ncbi:MAG: efflux RND transporter periplasmic adaptor subunit [Ignavibacteria bacterium]|jgi:HlyD family secretion protein